MKFEFVKESHQYFLNGEEIPSVTTIIKKAGLMPDYKGDAPAQFGTLVHEACARYVEKFELPTDPWVQVSVSGFISWCASYLPDALLVEKPMVNEKQKYAGTVDLVARCKNVKWLIDIKTGAFHPWHMIQLSAYDKMLMGTEDRPERFACLYLSTNEREKFTFKPFTWTDISSAYSAFLNAHNLYKWRKNNGI